MGYTYDSGALIAAERGGVVTSDLRDSQCLLGALGGRVEVFTV